MWPWFKRVMNLTLYSIYCSKFSLKCAFQFTHIINAILGAFEAFAFCVLKMNALFWELLDCLAGRSLFSHPLICRLKGNFSWWINQESLMMLVYHTSQYVLRNSAMCFNIFHFHNVLLLQYPVALTSLIIFELIVLSHLKDMIISRMVCCSLPHRMFYEHNSFFVCFFCSRAVDTIQSHETQPKCKAVPHKQADSPIDIKYINNDVFWIV